MSKVVFISHRCTDEDHSIVIPLQEAFQNHGLTVIRDPFQGGDQTCDKIQSSIKQSTHFVLIATESSINHAHEYKGRQFTDDNWRWARWVTIEYRLAEKCALQQGLNLICVRVGNARIPEILQQYIYIPFEAGSSVMQLAENLWKCIDSTSPAKRLSTDPQLSRMIVEEARNLEREHAISNDQRQLHTAIELYDRAILHDFCNHHAWLNKGWCLWKLGDDSIAWNYVNMAQLLRPDSDRVKQVIERMYGQYRTLR